MMDTLHMYANQLSRPFLIFTDTYVRLQKSKGMDRNITNYDYKQYK